MRILSIAHISWGKLSWRDTVHRTGLHSDAAAFRDVAISLHACLAGTIAAKEALVKEAIRKKRVLQHPYYHAMPGMSG